MNKILKIIYLTKEVQLVLIQIVKIVILFFLLITKNNYMIIF